MTMISLGGVIGAGLFVGSSAVITTTGPGRGALLPGGRLPDRAGHADARRDGGRQPAGRLVRRVRAARRWAAGRASASAGCTGTSGRSCSPSRPSPARRSCSAGSTLPLWLMALVLMALLTGINLASVKSFGEFEFWFAGIKVVAIVAFILIAARLPVRHRRRRLARPLEPHEPRGLRARGRRHGPLRRGDRDLRLRGRGDRHDRGRGVRRAGGERDQGGQPGRAARS